MSPVNPVDLSDFGVVLPVRIDTRDRVRNLRFVLEWFRRDFRGQEVLVVEHAPRAVCADIARELGAIHVFLEADGCFHKSYAFNMGLALSARRFVLLYDCDVFFDPGAIQECATLLRSQRAHFVYPYNGVMLQIRWDGGAARCEEAARSTHGRPFTAEGSEKPPGGLEHLHGTREEPSTGGALGADRRRLILAGGFNPNIVSYGCEDMELASRLGKLKESVQWLGSYNCFHLHHRRGQDSHYNNFHASNLAEWEKIQAMSGDEVARYVRNGFRRLHLDSRRTLVVEDTPDRYAATLHDTNKKPADDVAFVLPLPDLELPPALVPDLLDRVDRHYENYQLYLVDLQLHRSRAYAHRDHVIYVPCPEGTASHQLRHVLGEIDRPLLVLCGPFFDASPEKLEDALEKLRGSARRAIELPELGAGSERGHRIREVMRRRFPWGGRSLALRREAALASIEASS